jgi:hypothetical protein
MIPPDKTRLHEPSMETKPGPTGHIGPFKVRGKGRAKRQAVSSLGTNYDPIGGFVGGLISREGAQIMGQWM